MIRRLSFLCALLITFIQTTALAHNTHQANLKLEFSKHFNLLHANISQYGAEQALVKSYPNIDLATIDPNKFKELLVRHFKDSVHISINGEQVALGKGAIKLGAHDTKLMFRINSDAKEPHTVEVIADCFKENEGQFNFFTVVYKDLHARAKLTKANHFTASFNITESEIVVKDSLPKTDDFKPWWLVALLLAGIFIALLAIYIVKDKSNA